MKTIINDTNSTCVVLGAAPASPLPNIHPNVIYSANGAAALLNCVSYPKTKRIAVVSELEAKNSSVYRKIIQNTPDHVIIRGHKRLRQNVQDPFDSTREKEIWSGIRQHRLIEKAIGQNIKLFHPDRDTVSGRLKYAISYILGISTSFHISTGAWTVLLALLRHREMAVITSGITLKQGGHFYGEGFFHASVAAKDLVLFELLVKNYGDRLMTTDKTVANLIGCKLWAGAQTPRRKSIYPDQVTVDTD